MTTAEERDPAEYCREVELHLCRRNAGHLIRIVGPAFDLVCGWATRGVPLSIACLGIDRCVARADARSRRRPVRVEFCEADVLDAFDEWRRAVGVPEGAGAHGDEPPVRNVSLPSHLERVTARLTVLRSSASQELASRVAPFIDALDRLKAQAASARGDRRQEILDQLGAMDRDLLAAARSATDGDALAGLRRQADDELRAFRSRLSDAAFAEARERSLDRLVRERWGLPVMSVEP